MKNTAHFGLTNNGDLVFLGNAVDTPQAANVLADAFEANNADTGLTIADPMLNINDLYKLSGQISELLNGLNNGVLAGDPITLDLWQGM
jgi:hypothetical protein